MENLEFGRKNLYPGVLPYKRIGVLIITVGTDYSKGDGGWVGPLQLAYRDFFAITNKNGGVPETIQTLKHLGTKGLLGSRKQSHLRSGSLRSAPVDV